MSPLPSIDVAHLALDPVEALRGEHSQLESWVRESFAALESMHGELSEWQRDLTCRQAELDQREAGVADCERDSGSLPPDITALQQQLAQARDEFRQLEEENSEQLVALEDVERQLVAAQTELRLVRRYAEEAAAALDAERVRTADERCLWTGELREMRRAVRRQGQMLISLGATEPPADESDPEDVASHASPDESADGESASTESAARAAELRRRATSRRANRRSQ